MAVSLRDTELYLEEILSKHGLMKNDLDKKCSPCIRNDIALKISNWKMIGHHFGIPKEKLIAIQIENRTEEERRVELLCTWSEQKGKQATYLKLIDALYHRKRCDLVDTLCGLIKSNHIGGKGTCTPCGDQQQSSGSIEKSVEIEIQELEKSFKELHHQLKSELVANKVSVETLLQSLTTLPIYFKREYETAIQKLLPEVEGKKTITELFLRLNPLFTFIDYNLPEYLASEFGSEDLNHKMSSYVETIKVFMKRTTVEELMHYWPGDEVCPEHFSRFCAKISDNPKTYTLEKLNHLRRNLCSVLRLSEVLFNLVWIGASSSFIAVWLIPYVVVTKLIESFSNVEEVFFEDNHILMIELNEKVIYSSNNTENKPASYGVQEICGGIIQSYERCLAEKDYTIDSLRHENEQLRQSSHQIEALQQEHSGLQQQIQWLQQQSANVGFKQIYIYRDQILGTGAYGTVYKARCDNLMCAAKILHSTLVQFDQTTVHGRPSQQWLLRWFEQECELMSTIRHPNIVQHLGCHDDSHTRLPVLLMELLNGNLTNYLESSTHDQPIPYHIRVNICHDITLALVFLHSNNIVHRDLSSNNILLTCGLQAKVTDFGMARLSDLNSHTNRNWSRCPGTHVYMPPEAVQDQPVYTEKIDCFSFGVIAIQIITRQFPNPGDRHRPIDEHYPAILTTVTVREVERRHNHISEIDPRNPILPIALDCLQDNPEERPSAQLLCERFAHLKQSTIYSERATQVEVDNRQQISDDETQLIRIRQVHEVIQSCEGRLADKDHTIESLRQENEQLRQQLLQRSCQIEALQQQIQRIQQESREKDQLEARKNAEVRHEIIRWRQQLEQSRLETEARNQRVEALESQIKYQRQSHVQKIHGLQEVILSQRRFIDESSAHMSQKNQTIAHQGELIAAKMKEIHLLEQQLHHLKGQSSKDIDDISSHIKLEVEEHMRTLSFDQQSPTSMSTGSRVPVLNFSAESLPANQPASNFQLEWSSENKRAPCGMAAHCNAIVCGKVVYFQPADTNSLYAYNSETDKWNQLPDLKNSNCSMAIVNNLVTAIGGSKLMTGYSRKLYSLTGKAKGMKWIKLLQPMPTKRSETSALCVKMALIVAGGEGKNGKVLATVEVMNTDTKQWSSASDLPEPLWGASATLCGNVFYIVGGVNVRPIKSVYKCTITSLLQSCQPAFPFTYTTASDSLEQHQLWNKVSDPPVTGPTCVSLYGQLILIGGEDPNSTHTRSAAIHKYDQATDEWKVISHMSMGRNQCFVAVVPDNLLMIVGGWITTTQDQTASDVVDFAITEISDVHSQN